MLEMTRGQKESVSKRCGSLAVDLEIYNQAPMEVDITCFGLDAAGRLSDERYFVFYNQKSSPGQEITLQERPADGTVRFRLALDKLPAGIEKLSFAASVEGTKTMRELAKGYVRLLCGEKEQLRYTYNGNEFAGERAIVVCEIYRKNGDWRFGAVGRGFNGGLKALVESFGGVVQDSGRLPSASGAAPSPAGSAGDGPKAKGKPRPPANPAFQSIVKALPLPVCTRMDDLARQCRGETEYLTSIYKNMFLSLALYPKTAARPVRVVMCADASGSMFEQYRNGRVQRVVDKFFTFASTLSDACSMDFWAFGAKSRQFGSVTMENVRDYTFAESGGFERWMSMLNYQYNNEPEAMRDIMMIYGACKEPVMVLFLTDGHLSSDWQVEEILIKTSRFPIYWQFVGTHGDEFGILAHLDEIDGRHTANAGFLRTDDIDDLTDGALFQGLLANLDGWLEELSSKKMLEG